MEFYHGNLIHYLGINPTQRNPGGSETEIVSQEVIREKERKEEGRRFFEFNSKRKRGHSERNPGCWID
jgi:hypothetical protein